MVDELAIVVVAASLAVAALCSVTAARNRPTGDPHLYAAGAVEAVLLVQVVIAITRLVSGDRPEDLATFVAYLILVPFVLPVGFALSLVERTRWGAVILGLGCLVLAVLIARLQDIWSAGG